MCLGESQSARLPSLQYPEQMKHDEDGDGHPERP